MERFHLSLDVMVEYKIYTSFMPWSLLFFSMHVVVYMLIQGICVLQWSGKYVHLMCCDLFISTIHAEVYMLSKNIRLSCCIVVQGFTCYHLSCDHEKRTAAYFWGVLERSFPPHIKAEVKGLRLSKDMKVHILYISVYITTVRGGATPLRNNLINIFIMLYPIHISLTE